MSETHTTTIGDRLRCNFCTARKTVQRDITSTPAQTVHWRYLSPGMSYGCSPNEVEQDVEQPSQHFCQVNSYTTSGRMRVGCCCLGKKTSLSGAELLIPSKEVEVIELDFLARILLGLQLWIATSGRFKPAQQSERSGLYNQVPNNWGGVGTVQRLLWCCRRLPTWK